MRRAFVRASHDTADFCEFVHQRFFGVEPACGVDNQHVCLAMLRCVNCVKDDRCGFRLFAAPDKFCVGAFTPDSELFFGSSAERIACCNDDALSLRSEAASQLPYRCRFPRAVHSED